VASATRQKWSGRWEQVRGRAREIWGWLTDDDLTRMQGDCEQLVGLIHERTGETREQIEKRLREESKEHHAN
jgi:uncharacterized protein YjbJ (UPF0337 family)